MKEFNREHVVKFCPRLADSKSARLSRLISNLAPNPDSINAKQFVSLLVVDWMLHLGEFETAELHRSVMFFEPDIDSACLNREVWVALLDGAYLRRVNAEKVMDLSSGEMLDCLKPATMYLLNLTEQLNRITNHASSATPTRSDPNAERRVSPS